MEQNTTSHGNKKVHSCNLEFKLTAADFVELYGNWASAKKFNDDVKHICKWRKSKEAITEKKTSRTGKNGKRLSGGGCKSKDVDLVKELKEWIAKQRAAILCVLGKLIMFKAKCLLEEQVGADAAEKMSLWLVEGGLWTLWIVLDYPRNEKLLQFKRTVNA